MGNVLGVSPANVPVSEPDVPSVLLVVCHASYDTGVASKDELLRRLALARKAKANKAKPQEAPKIEEPPLAREVPADGQRHVANDCAKDAMVMGWDRAIQKHAYENRISEDEIRRLLDQALDYNDKADPAGRIDELEDWRIQKRGRSDLRARN